MPNSKLISPLFSFSFLLITQHSFSQAPTIEWQNTIGGSNYDWLYSLQQTTDGGYILGGYSFSGISGDKTEAGLGSYDYWVVKINSIGSIEWQNTIGGSGDDELHSLQQTTDGGYILGGKSSSGISGDKTEASLGSTDYWVVKLNNSGGIEWQNTIGGSGEDYMYSIQQTTEGGYILGGWSSSGISGDKIEAGLGSYDYWVVKINSIGGIEWQNTIGGSSDDKLFSIQQTSDGGYILGGNSSSGIFADKTEASSGSYDYWVVKLNSGGAVEWQNTIGGIGYEELSSIHQTTDGGYILGGNSGSGISGDKIEAALGSADFWVVKLNSSGSIEWQNTIGGSGDDSLFSIQQTTDGGYILGGGSSSGTSGDKTEASLGLFDYWVVKLEGYCIPTTEICNTLDDNCNGIIDDGVMETISISASGATTFCQGGSVILTASHSGTFLQWKKNGVNIAGATGTTYTATKTGDYTCQTSSICGTGTSVLIHITVNKNPSASISTGGATTFCAGGSVTLSETPIGGSTYQWYKGPTAITGATSTTYIATTTGNYKCKVTKTATGCFKNSNTITVSVPCREENNAVENTFSIFPNPVFNFITIETDFATEKTLYITDAFGQIMQKIITSENIINIDLQNIASGIYFIKVEDGINSVTKKFMKQ